MHFQEELDRLSAEIGLPPHPTIKDPRNFEEQTHNSRAFVADILRKKPPSELTK
ncbi:hypothetical protein KJ996_03725 [Patescibacteria group bacterium]|nr:hypothetical protein [Patescibacteria group bacterium]